MDGGTRDTSDLDRHIKPLRPCGSINASEVRRLCVKAKDILLKGGDVQRVDSPVTARGDLFRQFHDLKELFTVADMHATPSPGDFVDRGFYSVEKFLLLLALKMWHPDHITLIWGNHDSRGIAQVRAFYDETVRNYVYANVWRYCTDVLGYLTLSALVDGKVFCVRGRLSPAARSLDEIRVTHRKQEVPQDGPTCDPLCSAREDKVDWRK